MMTLSVGALARPHSHSQSYAIQDSWFNKEVVDKTPRQIQQAYVDVALQVLQDASKLQASNAKAEGERILEKLQVHDKANGGSTAFLDLKYLVREGRQNGIHFTPTVLLNGLEDPQVSSSWGKDEWDKFFVEKI
jgi:protein-disulfide isomerase